MVENGSVAGHSYESLDNSGRTAENEIVEQANPGRTFPEENKKYKYKNLPESNKPPFPAVIIDIVLLINADRFIHLNHPTIG